MGEGEREVGEGVGVRFFGGNLTIIYLQQRIERQFGT